MTPSVLGGGTPRRAVLVLVLVLALALAACLAAAQAKDWQSGEIVSRETFKYGAFETRVKASRGSGGITGFIIIVPDAEHTAWQELAVEFYGKGDGKTYQTQIITPGPPEADVGALPRAQHIEEKTSPSSYFDSFHTARIEWEPKRLAFLYDGTLVREETDPSKFNQFFDASKVVPMEIRVTLWAGYSDWSGQVDAGNPPGPAEFEYVRYEKWDEGAGKFVPGWEDTFDSFDSARWQKADWTFPFAVNDFAPGNVNAQGGNLVLDFTRAAAAAG